MLYSYSNTGIAEVHKCNPENASEVMIYTGEKSTECQITIFNFTPENHDLIWMARLDEDFENTQIKITVAEDVEKIELIPDEIYVLGQKSKIRCQVIGGNPVPDVSMLWENLDSVDLIYDFEQTFINENGGPSGYNPGDMVGLGDRGDSPNYTLELSEDEEIIKASLLQFFTDLLRRLGPVKKDE